MSDIQKTAAGEAADKLAVVEALYRYCAGIDLRDQALLASSFSENTVLDLRPAGKKAGFDYPVIEGRDTVTQALSTSLAGVDTTHSVSNPRVTGTGDTAQMEALVEAQHVPSADPARHYLMKNRYDTRLERQGPVWVTTVAPLDEGGLFCTPIGGPFWTPIDTADHRHS